MMSQFTIYSASHAHIFLVAGIALAVVAGILLLAFVFSRPPKQTDTVSDRMKSLTKAGLNSNDQNVSLADTELGFSLWTRVFWPVLQNLGELALKLSPGGATDLLRKRLSLAGSPRGFGVIEFIGARVVCGILGFFMAIWAQAIIQDSLTKLVIFILVFGMLFLMPDLMLSRMIESRQYRIRKVLADTIDLLVVSVEAGMGFDGAIQKVVEKMKGPLADEFARVLHEMKLGKPRARSLKDMAGRINITEITTFVAAIYQSELLGVSIATVLRVQSESIRIAHSQRIREAAAKLPVKMLFPLVFLIFPAIFLVLLGPGLIAIKNAFSHL